MWTNWPWLLTNFGPQGFDFMRNEITVVYRVDTVLLPKLTILTYIVRWLGAQAGIVAVPDAPNHVTQCES